MSERINVDQYHAGLRKLWSALGNPKMNEDDVYTRITDRIDTLEAQLAEVAELRDEMKESECCPSINPDKNIGWADARNFYQNELTAILAKSNK